MYTRYGSVTIFTLIPFNYFCFTQKCAFPLFICHDYILIEKVVGHSWRMPNARRQIVFRRPIATHISFVVQAIPSNTGNQTVCLIACMPVASRPFCVPPPMNGDINIPINVTEGKKMSFCFDFILICIWLAIREYIFLFFLYYLFDATTLYGGFGHTIKENGYNWTIFV